jgi:hypothetical protein
MPEGRRALGRPRHRWVNNVTIDLVEIVWGGVGLYWLYYRDKWRALVNVAMNIWVP